MKNFASHSHRRANLTACLGLVLALGAGRALANVVTQTPGTPRSTNSVTTEIKIPTSLFVTPHSQAEGRDPFFPRSMRPYSAPVVIAPATVTNAPVVSVFVDLRLSGVSGTPEHRLAIINNRTFETGEEAEVSTGTGRVRIRCLEIRADVAIVMVNGERREVRFRAEK